MLQPSPVENSLLVRARATLGDFELTVCTDGTYLLDGGAMFGVVPKTLWQKRIPADAENRSCSASTPSSCAQDSIPSRSKPESATSRRRRCSEIFQSQALLPASLAAAGVDPAEVDIVINTHLHFDHCGWNTTLHPDGSVTPTFPNARYFAHAGEVAHGHLQLDRDRVSYLSPNYDPLIESGQMTLLDDAAVLAGGPSAPALRSNSFPAIRRT